MKHYDVIVIGGGHAGVEAALAASRLGARVALATMRYSDLGVMSCNPAFGGLGKGHLVREVDALDGVIGRASDAAAIQYRLLNRSKGPAVQGPRVQADRVLYQRFISDYVSRADLDVIEGEVTALEIKAGIVQGVQINGDQTLAARAVVLTTGTFLGGKIFIGDQQFASGRMGDTASSILAQQLRDMDLPMGRLKTGTPPRLDGRTIQWDALEKQHGDDAPEFMSFLTTGIQARQVPCAITHTNPHTHALIEENLHLSAMYGGHIEGVGPRYCPSIEDKIVRFADKSSHQIFLEPEGLTTDVVYPNGVSTSLPQAVQEQFIHSIAGLEKTAILQPGYAVEYDYIDPRSLTSALALREMPNLFFAGQINGTTGYEEAAAQGLVAGLNAARLAQGQGAISFKRSDSYIGVMIDDLILRGVTEPYRMFTSRAEYRLSLRPDNADLRLTPLGLSIGCVGSARAQAFGAKLDALEAAKAMLSAESFSPTVLNAKGFKLSEDGVRRTALQLLERPDVDFETLAHLLPEVDQIAAPIRAQLGRESLYVSYLERQKDQIARLQQEEARPIPPDLDYGAINGLSKELVSKLTAARPETIAQAARIDGMTPTALILILARTTQKRAS